MKKFLGITAVALIVGAPALAQNASTMTYHLMLNGTPSETSAAQYDTSTATESEYSMPSDKGVLNWAAKLVVDGTIDGVAPGGAANIVVDLALKKDGALVGGGSLDTDGGFGIGTPDGEAGFFSLVMKDLGGGAYAQQPAAFPWVFNTWLDPAETGADITPIPPYGYGRLIDPVVENNGPNMAQFTYPSTFKYYRPANAATANTTTVTAASGTLMGMGAGYKDFYFGDDAPERGGVGLIADNASGQGCYGCGDYWCMNIAGRPVIEGQINMKGMPAGTYTLELTAGTGNNVLLQNINCSPYAGGTNGAFAVAAATTTGDTITFVYNPIITDVAPVVATAQTVRTHGAAGEFAINMLAAGAVEPRQGGVKKIVVTFDSDVAAQGGGAMVIGAGGNIQPTGCTVGSVVLSGSAPGKTSDVMTLTVSGTADQTTCSIVLHNIVHGTSVAMADKTLCTSVLYGDVTGDRSVAVNDTLQVKLALGQALTAANFLKDVTCDGAIAVNDTLQVKLNLAHGVAACP